MEKQLKKTSKQNWDESKIYACFQDMETLKLLSFLEQNQNKIVFKGVNEEQGRRTKEFKFDKISFLTDKLKHTYGGIVKQAVYGLLKGQSRSALIYGSDESKKQKILVGQSQNAGLLFLTLAELFQNCYDRQYEDKVTVKLSCWEYRDGQLSDVVGATTQQNLGSKGNWIADDLIEKKVIVGIPQIIIRNLKSALKIIKIYMKKVEESRQQNEEQTETLIFTIKLQIDNAYDKQGHTTQYLMSKFHIVKLANPFFAKNPSKNPQWFISLFNYLQTEALDKKHKLEQKKYSQDSDLSIFLRDCVIKNVHQIMCFSCFTNKMTSNQCLTALKFNSYLQQLKIQPNLIKLNIFELKQQQIILQGELCKAQEQQQNWMKGQKREWVQIDQVENNKQLQSILGWNQKIMQYANFLEYQYANVFTVACDKLQKYIFNQQIQDYFYAKKVNIQINPQLKDALLKFFGLKRQIIEGENKIIKRVANTMVKLKRQNGQDKEYKYLINTKLKEKQIYEKLFEIYNTMSGHFLYEQNQDFASYLENYQPKLKKQEENSTITANFTYYEPSQAFTYAVQKQKQNKAHPTNNQIRQTSKKKKNFDQMEMMFTNSNANLCGRKFKK